MRRGFWPGPWLVLLVLGGGFSVRAADWWAVLRSMPLATNVVWITHTNSAPVLFEALTESPVVKGIVLMPGATDELYFFHRVAARLTNAAPTLADAVQALTNQTPLRATFRAPLLLLYSQEDVLELEVRVEHPATAAKLKESVVPGPQQFWDRDWAVMREHLRQVLPVRVYPYARQSVARHFYRHSFRGWNLTAWETVEAVALAGKSRAVIGRGRVEFELDERVGGNPRLEEFPR